MSTLLKPAFAAAYDEAADRVVVTFRDGRDGLVVELDPVRGDGRSPRSPIARGAVPWATTSRRGRTWPGWRNWTG